MKVGRWSPAAGSNNAAAPDGWPEGQLPSTVNDCARELMAAVRTMASDMQYFDHAFTPTYISASSFSVPGNQTSAIHIGRRLKVFDATAGVQQIIYATVISVSFTAVTTIHIESDSGSLTSSLSSFGLSIISNNNNSMPRDSDMTISSLAVTGNMSISGAAAINGAVQMGSTLSVSGAAKMNSTLSISATCTAALFVAPNTVKAFVAFFLSASSSITPSTSYNVASISRSATGVSRITLSTGFADGNFLPLITITGFARAAAVGSLSASTTSLKIKTVSTSTLAAIDGVNVYVAFMHA